MENKTNSRIASLRQYMQENDLQAFIIPSTDAHISEYIPKRWAARQWISGFAGSAGTVAVTREKAGLWTDSRYFLQAEKDLADSEIRLFKERTPDTPSIADWLKNELTNGDRVGIDGNVYPAKEALQLKAALEPENITLAAAFDPFEEIWTDRPPLPCQPVKIMPVELAGESTLMKIVRTLDEAGKAGADSLWISSLDTIAWLFNLRGADVPYNPVTLAHAFVSRGAHGTILFIDNNKMTSEAVEQLEQNGVTIAGYSAVSGFLAEICNYSVCADKSRLSYNIYKMLSERNWIVDAVSPADTLKSMKNETEIEGFRRSMIRDGAAFVGFWMWLENAVASANITEYAAGAKLKEYRSRQECFAGESFPPIVGYGANAAIVHYHAKEEDAATIAPEGLLLIDSGGQYDDGTTDITRTIAVGAVTEAMKKDYTLALKGVIALSRAVFPAGARGSQIDMLARKAMWEHGINYLHGTGHGVGHHLNVHEGPQSIRQEENPTAMRPNMITTIEPGIYRDHAYGIRIENMTVVRPAMTTEFGDFYRFETLTLCPIDVSPLLPEMMNYEEIEWLNNYHKQVYEQLSPALSDEETSWLKEKTKPLARFN